jgi:hypothetical protein
MTKTPIEVWSYVLRVRLPRQWSQAIPGSDALTPGGHNVVNVIRKVKSWNKVKAIYIKALD